MESTPTRIAVRVTPGARTPGLTGRRGDAWAAKVAAPPERGRANVELAALLAGILGLSRRAVRVVAGETSRDKLVEVTGLDQVAVEERLRSRLDASVRTKGRG